MAARTRTGGSSIAIQSEDFQPISEWKEEEGASLLFLHLPDFTKEQLKITYVHSSHVIKVAGDRPSTGNKWSRFNQSFAVPQNCNVQKIQGKFQNGVLTITMPKITITQPSIPPKPASTTTTDKGYEKKETPQMPQESMAEHKAQKGVDESAKQKQTDGKKMNVQSPGPKKAMKNTATRKDDMGDQDKIGKSDGDDKKKSEAIMEKKAALFSQEENGKKRKESLLAESEESSKKRKEVVADVSSIEKKNKNNYNGGATSEKGKEILFGERVKNVAASAKKRMKGLGSEERQSLVNVGVAILVIAALGAYISYSYGSSANSKD